MTKTDKIEWDSGDNKEKPEARNGIPSIKRTTGGQRKKTQTGNLQQHGTKWTVKLTRKRGKGRKRSPRNQTSLENEQLNE